MKLNRFLLNYYYLSLHLALLMRKSKPAKPDKEIDGALVSCLQKVTFEKELFVYGVTFVPVSVVELDYKTAKKKDPAGFKSYLMKSLGDAVKANSESKASLRDFSNLDPCLDKLWTLLNSKEQTIEVSSEFAKSEPSDLGALCRSTDNDAMNHLNWYYRQMGSLLAQESRMDNQIGPCVSRSISGAVADASRLKNDSPYGVQNYCKQLVDAIGCAMDAKNGDYKRLGKAEILDALANS